ncbi:MAG TPA: hypothetical protein VGR31_15800 [Planctomycetota bacterium]|nr:hypothetical protein [Planctomycetota bacterium]
MIAALASLVALALQGNLARLGDVEITGPVRDLVLSLGSSGESRLQGELLRGEQVHLAVPLALGDPVAAIAPEIRWEGADDASAERGRARFLGWREDRAAQAIEELPPGLRARSRPALVAPEIRLPRAALAFLPACLVAGLALRRRALASVAVALVGSGVLLGLGWPKDVRRVRAISVLETEADGPLALSVTATWERATARAAELEDTLVRVARDGARIVWTGSFARDGAWTASAPASAVLVLRRFEPGEARFHRDRNGSRPLAETWLREDGEWTARGAWPTGAALPPARPGPPPPGWIAADLPQGVTVLLGRTEGPENAEVWIRETGF